MKTKEVIQAKIDLIHEYPELFDDRLYYEKSNLLDTLEQKLHSAKSIKDIEKAAFEAGREIECNHIELGNTYKHETFEDYLKHKEDGTTNK